MPEIQEKNHKFVNEKSGNLAQIPGKRAVVKSTRNPLGLKLEERKNDILYMGCNLFQEKKNTLTQCPGACSLIHDNIVLT